MKGLRRWAALMALLVLLPLHAGADVVAWPAALTAGQEALRRYVEAVDEALLARKLPPVNNLMELYPGLAVLAVTASPEAEASEGVELEFTLDRTDIHALELRVTDPARFAALAACCVSA